MINCIETQDARSKGYGHQGIWIGGRNYEMYSHVAAYINAHGHFPRGLCVRHQCDNPGCINPVHLILGTHAENMADMASRGRAAKPLAKITQADADEIRRVLTTGVTQRELAQRYGLHQSTVSLISSGRIWRG